MFSTEVNVCSSRKKAPSIHLGGAFVIPKGLFRFSSKKAYNDRNNSQHQQKMDDSTDRIYNKSKYPSYDEENGNNNKESAHSNLFKWFVKLDLL